ncbi:MAG: aldehyde dehydrogenase family protein [Alphaproteobacteria bacterium]|nr:aldehyde dehydrogenase family protein [Alphaproteobacteria bacterium]
MNVAALEVTAPFDGAVIARLPRMDAAQVEAALASAYALYRNRDAWLPKSQRIEILRAAVRIIAGRAEELALQAAREGGKPLIDSRVEIARAIDGIEVCIKTLRTHAGNVVPMGVNAASSGHLAFTQYEPIDVVAAFSAFNHPFNLIVHQVGPAVAAGCPVLIKPASSTPLSCIAFAEILHEAGLPKAWCQVILPETNALATKMVTDKRIGFFSFIGSGAVGWGLRAQLAPGTRCALKHGGAAPVIVAADADLAANLPRFAKGGFYHAGQVCVSVQRIYAHASIAEGVARELGRLGNAMKVGDPTRPDTEVGPLISHGECDRVHDWVREAVQGGAKLISGGEKISASCYQPTVLFNPPEACRVSNSEIFGPVICVYPYTDINEAIARANSLAVSFQAAVFTRDLDTALRVYSRIDATAVMVNNHTAFRVDWMPFAGARESGHGVGGIPHTIHDMQTEKMMVIRSQEI